VWIIEKMKNCNGKCKGFVVKMPNNGGGRYANGQKRCNVCDKYIIWEGICCPCCGEKLRSRTRQGNLRDKFLVVKRI